MPDFRDLYYVVRARQNFGDQYFDQNLVELNHRRRRKYGARPARIQVLARR